MHTTLQNKVDLTEPNSETLIEELQSVQRIREEIIQMKKTKKILNLGQTPIQISEMTKLQSKWTCNLKKRQNFRIRWSKTTKLTWMKIVNLQQASKEAEKQQEQLETDRSNIDRILAWRLKKHISLHHCIYFCHI